VDEGAASRIANDVLMLRAQLKSLGERTVIANKVALEAEKARDERHNQVEQIEQRLHPKRARSHDDAGDAHEMLTEVENWDLRDHRQQATRVQNRGLPPRGSEASTGRRTRGAAVRKLQGVGKSTFVLSTMTSGQETTMTSGQDVSEYLDCSDAPEDESISLFAGLLANPDMT
jgi:hypothetical protein